MPRKFILICPAGNEAEAKKHIPDIVDGKVSAPSKRVIGTAFMALGYVNEQQLDGVIDALDYADEGIFDRLLAANGNTSLGTLYRSRSSLLKTDGSTYSSSAKRGFSKRSCMRRSGRNIPMSNGSWALSLTPATDSKSHLRMSGVRSTRHNSQKRPLRSSR